MGFGLALATAGLVACAGEDPATEDVTPDPEPTPGTEFLCSAPYEAPSLVGAAFRVRQSVAQLAVWRVDPGTEVVLRAPGGSESERVVANAEGAAIFRELAPAAGYAVDATVAGAPHTVTGLKVPTEAESLPEQGCYARQKVEKGFGYITTRDGTKLSIYVNFPEGEGPFPTVVNYSGYDPSKPGEPADVPGAALFCKQYPVLCDAPTDPSGLMAGLLGYATVSVNLRGTGCSGGAYDFFETMQLLDGYDVIETVAAQSWVKGHRVGMTGLSYPGLSQLWVAKTRPPSLAAISPMSVIADVDDSTLSPGGVYNDGFALSWAEHVLNGAKPYGKGWEKTLVDAGDVVCAENQELHGLAVNVVDKALAHPFYESKLYDPLRPEMFVDQIDVPVFVSGQWQDEQTGGHFPAFFDKFTSAPVTRFTVMNGVHADGFTPHVLAEWKLFLDLYVAETAPVQDKTLWSLAPKFFNSIYGAEVALPDLRFTDKSYAEAKAAFEAEPSGRIAFEVGADPATPGAPVPRFQATFDAWPLPSLEPARWYLQPGGVLAPEEPLAEGGASSFALDRAIARTTTLPSGDIMKALPPYVWPALQEDRAVVFETAPLGEAVVMAGPASADLWVQSSAPDADLEVTLVEVRPDGQEMYVQSGWLRASFRELRSDATALRPTKTRLEASATALPAGEWTPLRVEVFPFAHVFRQGSRLRVVIGTPGGNRPEWKFLLSDKVPDGSRHAVAHEQGHASSLLLPIAPSITVPAEAATLAPCPSLRGQPCRTNEPFQNTAYPFVEPD